MAIPTGTVLFKINDTGIANLPLDANGRASTTFTAGAAGTEAIEGDYSGDATHNTSVGTATEVVNDPIVNTTTTVTLTPNPANPGDTVTVTFQVSNA